MLGPPNIRLPALFISSGARFLVNTATGEIKIPFKWKEHLHTEEFELELLACNSIHFLRTKIHFEERKYIELQTIKAHLR